MATSPTTIGRNFPVVNFSENGHGVTKLYGRLFLMPGLWTLIAIIIFPLFFTIALSFSNWSVANAGFDWVGGRNWSAMTENGRFWASMVRLLPFAFLTVVIQYVLGFAIAMFSWKGIASGRFFRVLWLIPMMTTPVVMSVVWNSIFQETVGPVNFVLTALGVSPIAWLSSTTPAMFAIIVAEVWQWTPFMFLLLLAGLLSLPKEPFLAASIDGAGPVRTFFKVTLPMMAPVSIGAIIIRLIEASKIFDTIYAMTIGGPGSSTESPSYYIYITGLRNFDLANGATLSLTYLIFFIIVLTVIAQVLGRLAKPKGS
jgi:multiple sugar transport system permease protein